MQPQSQLRTARASLRTRRRRAEMTIKTRITRWLRCPARWQHASQASTTCCPTYVDTRGGTATMVERTLAPESVCLPAHLDPLYRRPQRLKMRKGPKFSRLVPPKRHT
jgi:hypothetical protein